MTVFNHRSSQRAVRTSWVVVASALVVLVALMASCSRSDSADVSVDPQGPSTDTRTDPVDPGGVSTIRPTRPPDSPPTSTVVTVPPVTAPADAQELLPTEPAPSVPPGAAPRISDFLAPMGIDDRPQPWIGYDRSDWPHWADTDGDGCDARQQALIAASITPAQVDFYRCTVVAGDWYSSYDGISTDDSSSFDVDHLVPLRDAHWSGGWQWSIQQRRLFANDQANLWVVSASSNRSKGAKTPDQWRPERTEVWCEFAIRWVQVKVVWGLTATTTERDALGSMLERCATLPPVPVRR